MSSRPDGQGPQKRSSLPLVKTFSDEWAILQFLKRWTPQDIRKAIDGDVDLAALMLGNWTQAKIVSTLAKRNSKNIDGYLSAGNVLYWFSVRRPDLYQEITRDARGPEYINRNFDKVRNILFN